MATVQSYCLQRNTRNKVDNAVFSMNPNYRNIRFDDLDQSQYDRVIEALKHQYHFSTNSLSNEKNVVWQYYSYYLPSQVSQINQLLQELGIEGNV